jgi:hypothetical protein
VLVVVRRMALTFRTTFQPRRVSTWSGASNPHCQWMVLHFCLICRHIVSIFRHLLDLLLCGRHRRWLLGALVSFFLELFRGSDWEITVIALGGALVVVVLVVVWCFTVVVSSWFIDMLFPCWRLNSFTVICFHGGLCVPFCWKLLTAACIKIWFGHILLERVRCIDTPCWW